MVKVIIFDFMGVIFKVGDDTNELLIPYIQSLKNAPSETLKQLYLDASLGKISSWEFWSKAGFNDAEIPTVQHKYLNNCLTFDSAFTVCASKLKDRYELAILSNDISPWNAFLRKKHGIDNFISSENAFISSDLGLRKPEPKIYECVLSKFKIKGYESIFIDDYPERAAAACELGITGILFNRNELIYNGLQVRSFDELVHFLL